MRTKICILGFAVLAMVFAGCSRVKPEAIGSYNAVFTYVDPQEKDFVREPLKIAIERQIITPRPEKLLRIVWGDTTNFDDGTHHHIVMIVSSLKSPGFFGALVRRSLSPEAMDSARAKAVMFVKRDVWAHNQIVIIITGPGPEYLNSFILKNADMIFNTINDYTNENVKNYLFSSYQGEHERYDLERKIVHEYGFGIRVPRMFDWEKGSGKERFLWLRALEPERWVFVWWTPLDSVEHGKVSLKWLQHIRDSLCLIYYEGDSLIDGTLTYEHTTFKGFPAIKYRARWKNSKIVGGGPVVGYVFDDTLHNRRYVLDGAVFAPGVRKEPYLRHCEVIMLTFEPDTAKFLRELERKFK